MRPPRLPPARAVAVLFALGALVGTALDQIHVQGGVLHYRSPGPLGPPWWVFPQFGFAAAVMAGGWGVWADLFVAKDIRPPVRAFAIAFAWFVAAYLGSAVFQAHEVPYALATVTAFGARLVGDDDRGAAIAHALGCAAGGCAWEIVLSSTGAFTYDAPSSLVNVPLWLPGLYLHAGLFVREIGRLVLPARTEAA